MKVVSSGHRKSDIRSFLEHIAIPTLCVLALCLFTGLFFSNLTERGKYFTGLSYHGFWCRADGQMVFPWQNSGNVYWEPRLFLSITLASGSLTFSQAKAIDVIWDLVVGRGGQLLLTVLAYPVLRKSLLAHMEAQSIRMPVLASMVFEHGSCWTWWAIVRDLARSWSWKLFGYLWIIMYLLSFGTLVSAMTGYQSTMSPYYGGGQDSLTSFSKVSQVEGSLLIDGDRVGVDQHTVVFDDARSANYPLYNYYVAVYENCTGGYLNPDNNAENGTFTDDTGSFSIQWISEPDEESSSNLLQYICTTSNVTLAGKTHVLSAPPLSFQDTDGSEYYGSVILDSNGDFLSETWLEGNSQCQIQTKYQWGFSSLLLFCFCIASIIYTCVLLLLHIDIWFTSRSDRIHQKFSVYRDVMDLAEEIRSILGDQADAMPAGDLDKHPALKESHVSVCVYDYPASRQELLRARRGTLKEELRAGHEYSMGELKRSLGLAHGPTPSPAIFKRGNEDEQAESEALATSRSNAC